MSNQPLIPQAPATTGPLAGVPLFRLRNIGNNLLSKTFERTAFTDDVWRLQLGVRYTFN
ncbi:MAG: hypothetical protein HC937_03930 [Aquincola sp.]|nr:hypothetical protein [Aquincola sp.]